MRKDILPQWMECLFYIIFSLHLCKIDIRKFPLFMLTLLKQDYNENRKKNLIRLERGS